MKKTPEDIRQLEENIVALRQRKNNSEKTAEGEFERASKIGLRIGVELLSAVVVGAAVGYLVDELFSTRPWGLVVFLFFGGAAGILNVYRLAQKEDKAKIEEQ